MALPTDAAPDTYGPDEPLSVAEFAAHVALADPNKVVEVELDKAEQHAFRRHQRQLLGREPQLRQPVASRVPAPIALLRDVGRDARPATNARRRGSRRSSGSSPPSDDPEPDESDSDGLSPAKAREVAAPVLEWDGVLYHGTKRANLASIRRFGLQPHRRIKREPHGVYLSESTGIPRYMAIERLLPDLDLARSDWWEMIKGRRPRRHLWCVLRVDASGLPLFRSDDPRTDGIICPVPIATWRLAYLNGRRL